MDPDIASCPELQEVLKLQGYLDRLICSECPFAYRDFLRSGNLLDGPVYCMPGARSRGFPHADGRNMKDAPKSE